LYEPDLYVTPLEQYAEFTEQVETRVVLNNPYDLREIGLREMEVEISYNNAFLRADIGSIIEGNAINGSFAISGLENKSEDGKITFTIRSIAGENFNADGEIFSLAFDAFYPADSLNYSDIIVDVTPVDNNCVKFKSSPGRVSVKPVCAEEIRRIKFSEFGYFLEEVSPNPVSDGELSLEYSIGLQADTEISIFNSMGELIQSELIPSQQPGIYRPEISTENIGNGVYWIRLNSGPFSETKKVVIRK
jgi:hypothetical protein